MNDDMERRMLSEAHERGTAALSRIQGHERMCETRYKGIDDHLLDIKKSQELINARMWTVSGVIISLLLSILGYLLVKGVDHVFAEALQGTITMAIG